MNVDKLLTSIHALEREADEVAAWDERSADGPWHEEELARLRARIEVMYAGLRDLMLPRIGELRTEHEAVSDLDLLSEAGQAEAERRHVAYSDALGTVLPGHRQLRPGAWVDADGHVANTAMMEARLGE